MEKSRASNKISSNQTLKRRKKDLLCNNFASITALEETLPIITNDSGEDPCSCIKQHFNQENDFSILLAFKTRKQETVQVFMTKLFYYHLVIIKS